MHIFEIFTLLTQFVRLFVICKRECDLEDTTSDEYQSQKSCLKEQEEAKTYLQKGARRGQANKQR